MIEINLLVCDCGGEVYKEASLRKTTGHQYTETTVGYYHLFKCKKCGRQEWKYEHTDKY